ncbi:hypothetical protein DYB30_012717 [Aphanomyces astaci]|uniref:UBZ4-type domain-containing protein n=1 Tax=Aphanomyces astaci TaxID=112090 RepID=A0A397DNK1_APHAT|nr:hypothetical protein DYB30_012717 [Aphanomyces astaci]
MPACPICDRHFSTHSIESHVNLCLTKASSSGVDEDKPSPTLPSPPGWSQAAFHTHMLSSSKRPRPSTPQRHDEAPSKDAHTPKRHDHRQLDATRPMAERMRPTCFDDVLGQDELLGPDKPLRRLLESGHIPNMILWGPPGCGKTTVAMLLAKQKKDSQRFVALSATTAKLAHVREVFEKAVNEAQLLGRQTILFVDEIHRFSKLQQVEAGMITLVGATTENPSFELNAALLSRCRVFVLSKIQPDHIQHLLRRAARDAHYDCISALHKSIRGSDGDAALYWLGRMMQGGENPLYVARRLIRVASEDVGLADAHALPLATSCFQACHAIGLIILFWPEGMPECDVILAHCVAYLARAPKSVEVYKAYKRVKQTIDQGNDPDVPLHLRNAPTKLMESLNYGKGIYIILENILYHGMILEYKYNPDYEDGAVDQTYLPPELVGCEFLQAKNWVHKKE